MSAGGGASPTTGGRSSLRSDSLSSATSRGTACIMPPVSRTIRLCTWACAARLTMDTRTPAARTCRTVCHKSPGSTDSHDDKSSKTSLVVPRVLLVRCSTASESARAFCRLMGPSAALPPPSQLSTRLRSRSSTPSISLSLSLSPNAPVVLALFAPPPTTTLALSATTVAIPRSIFPTLTTPNGFARTNSDKNKHRQMMVAWCRVKGGKS
mmetsp:Transcript_11142/g.35376  ORF Transcript_11142/g.35376 Transcript_11142/m.35376 type:complete len:210 (-) Transcript_11142:244-873(-)